MKVFDFSNRTKGALLGEVPRVGWTSSAPFIESENRPV